MSKLIDLTNQQFGNWTVLRKTVNPNAIRARTLWECRCVCGTISWVHGDNLKKGISKSCGCTKKRDISGLRSGKLVALPKADDTVVRKNRKTYWLCKCDCGKEKWVRLTSFTFGQIKSCGCLFKFDPGVASFNTVFSTYKTNAEKRGYLFLLTKEQFKIITNESCHYCGIPPSNVAKHAHSNGAYVYNGIDRKDNSIGYVITNCVPCCMKCNEAKMTLSYQEFKNFINRIYSHWSSK